MKEIDYLEMKSRLKECETVFAKRMREGKQVDSDVLNDKVDLELWEERKGNVWDEDVYYKPLNEE